jgi:hypothetical protein
MNKVKIKPAYTVDLTDACTLEDVRTAFALAKHNANIPLTDDELKTIVQYTVDRVPTECFCNCNVEFYEVKERKKPWYKRFWNWITRKKN